MAGADIHHRTEDFRELYKQVLADLQYFMGTSPFYMTASAVFRMTRPPLVVGGMAMWWGYVKSILEQAPRYGDENFRHFLRRYQWECLVRGKAEATRRLNEAQRNVWQPTRSSVANARRKS